VTTPLNFYPRPKRDTGCGLHDSPKYNESPSNIRKHAAQCLEHGITWYKFLCSGANKVDRARIFLEAGGMPIVRLYSEGPHPRKQPNEDVLKQYADAGVRYVECGNEPNLRNEWGGDFKMKDAPELVAQQWLHAAEIVKGQGMIPLVYALSPGGDINHREFMIRFMGRIKQLGAEGAFEQTALAVHHRPLNHPPYIRPEVGTPEELGHPPMDTGLLEGLWLHDFFTEAIGWCPPMIGTEAGYSIGDDQDHSRGADGRPRYPKIDENAHFYYNREMFNMFDPGHVADDYAGPGWRDAIHWPDWYFCQCYWLEKNGTWLKDALWADWFASRRFHLFSTWIESHGIDWQRSDARKPDAPPAQPEPPTAGAETEAARNAAWMAKGIPYNPNAAFQRKARDLGLGVPETHEFDFALGGQTYRGQGFAGGIVYARAGDWGDIRKIDW